MWSFNITVPVQCVNKCAVFTFCAYVCICMEYMLHNFCLFHCLDALRHMKRYVKCFNVPVQVLLTLIHKLS